ncbi:hypothetical protein Smp_162080 [Schistosoma mansoni]|uniref:hypothetical protein n=1 Tax=Schistosoma mansoni TaxID=6183 RepID=UPI00022C83B3|nr:hypothetical protein Smp_162080 [Schistosoma mansoni]|eukprot:XP_018646863.1 hypothetical protein Smp_162080 [Schistosoma mansoni]
MDLKTHEVHSGHFMVSILEDSEDETDDSNNVFTENVTRYSSTDNSNQSTVRDKNRLIFENLASLFKYLEIAYSGKLTSPKWDKFRGLRFAIKYKIRLNNIVWREYHMQYVKKLKPVVVQFQTPIYEDHSKTEAVILEGKYWKRRVSTLRKEYSLWRVFAKNRIYTSQNRQIIQCANELLEGSDLCPYQFSDLSKSTSSKLMEEIMMDIDENLDLFLDQPITFPNRRDLPILGNADIMQPGLQQLQPDRSSCNDISCNIFQSVEPYSTFQCSSSDAHSCEYTWSSSDYQFNKYMCEATFSSTTLPLPETKQSRNPPLVERLGVVDSSSQICSSFLSGNLKSGLLDLATTSSEGCGPYLNNSVSEADYHGPHPYRPSFPVSHKRYFLHQPRVAGQHQSSNHSVGMESKYGLTTGSIHTKGHVAEPIQSFGYCVESNKEKGDHTNKSALLNALLRGSSISQNSNSPSDCMDTSAFQETSKCSSPLLCNALSNSGNCFDSSPNKHLIHLNDSSNKSVQAKKGSNLLTNTKGFSDSYTHPGYSYNDHSSITSINTVQNVDIPRINSLNVADNISVPVANYGGSSDCSVTQNHEPDLSVLTPTVSRADGSSFLISHNLLVKNCRTEPISFGVNDLLMRKRKNSNVQTLDPKGSVLDSTQGNPNYLVDVSTVPSQNSQDSTLIFKGNNGLCTQIHGNLSVSSNTGFNFSSRNSGSCTIPISSLSESNMFALPSSEIRNAYTEDSNSELETLVPGSWTEPQIFPHVTNITLNDMDQLPKVSVTSDKCLNVSKIIESNPSMLGRSSSAGNLFSLQHNQIPSCSIQGSATTTSSFGSTEILSPMFSNHKGFLYATSPSCSPPSISEQNDQQAKHILGNSSEERRRQSMQSGLQTLRQLLKLHSNLDNLGGSNRLAARRHLSNLEMPAISVTYSFGDTDMPSEMLSVGLRPSNGLDFTSDEQMISSGTEVGGTARASKAATLRSAAELIRKLRDERNVLETQCTNLKGEVKALKSAINLFCEKLPPSNSSSTRSISDQNLNSYYSEWFRAYVLKQTEVNWKFYIFSLIIGRIFKSYCNTTISSSRDQFIRSVYGWLDASCSLVQLRPAVMQALCTLGKTTSVLQEPNKLPEQSRSLSITNLL